MRRSADFSLDSSFILSFRITTTIHSIVQFVIICRKRLSVASQLLLRRHLCLPADVIRRIIDKYAGPSANLEGFTLSLYLLVRFARFFRYDELSNIAPVHLKFWPEYMRVFVLRARGDIYREGNYVYVKRLGNNFCLLALLERYILMRDIILSSSVALFRPVRLFICSLNCLSNQPSSFSGYVSVVLKGKNNLRSFKRSDFEHNNISRPSSEQPRAYTDILSDALSGRPHQSLKPSFTALSSREISLFL